ncbi:hypothetical protein K1T71_009650 [Dendrolimus kikuchii]|uniref:Uncharacterized protein n=1 Tax=Dendrolimus kikuchii TaxID=765133 RepID=A0ACC1CSF4_9NEOP|nr:hypothetical protein K1T71_009650 [Dendrolimus kikuchii]
MSYPNPTENKGFAQTIGSDSNTSRTCSHEHGKMSSSMPLSDAALLSILENWSGIDSEDDVELPFVPSLRETLLILPDDDLIDHRLEDLFAGATDDNVAAGEDASTVLFRQWSYSCHIWESLSDNGHILAT